jgi:hypothetical protein
LKIHALDSENVYPSLINALATYALCTKIHHLSISLDETNIPFLARVWFCLAQDHRYNTSPLDVNEVLILLQINKGALSSLNAPLIEDDVFIAAIAKYICNASTNAMIKKLDPTNIPFLLNIWIDFVTQCGTDLEMFIERAIQNILSIHASNPSIANQQAIDLYKSKFMLG